VTRRILSICAVIFAVMASANACSYISSRDVVRRKFSVHVTAPQWLNAGLPVVVRRVPLRAEEPADNGEVVWRGKTDGKGVVRIALPSDGAYEIALPDFMGERRNSQVVEVRARAKKKSVEMNWPYETIFELPELKAILLDDF